MKFLLNLLDWTSFKTALKWSKFKTLLKWIISLIIISLLFYKIGPQKIYATILSINPWFLIPVIIISLISQVFLAINISLLLLPFRKKLDFKRMLGHTSLSWSIGNAGIGRIGDLSLLWLLKKNEDVDYGTSLAVTMLDKIITIMLRLFLGSLGFLIFFNSKLYLKLLISSSVILAVFMFMASSGLVKDFFRKYILRKKARYLRGFSAAFSELARKQKSLLALNTFITLTNILAARLSLYFIFLAFGVHVSLIYVIIISSLVEMLTLIPISISGLGLREAGGAYLYSLIGVPLAVGASVLLLDTVKKYLMSLAFCSANGWLVKENKAVENKTA